MSKKINLTKEQWKIFNSCYKKAKEYFNLQEGWVLHHKDVTLRICDIDRYIQWRIEDLVPMTKSEHRRLHNLLDNPMNYEENRRKISEAMEKWRGIPRGTCSTMTEEDYRAMQSKAVSNRNKKMWQNKEYRDYIVEKIHISQCQPVRWIEKDIIFKCMNEAARHPDVHISRPSITASAKEHKTIKGYTFEFIEEV